MNDSRRSGSTLVRGFDCRRSVLAAEKLVLSEPPPAEDGQSRQPTVDVDSLTRPHPFVVAGQAANRDRRPGGYGTQIKRAAIKRRHMGRVRQRALPCIDARRANVLGTERTRRPRPCRDSSWVPCGGAPRGGAYLRTGA